MAIGGQNWDNAGRVVGLTGEGAKLGDCRLFATTKRRGGIVTFRSARCDRDVPIGAVGS